MGGLVFLLNIELVGCIPSQKNWRDLLVTGNENNLYFQFAESKTVARVSKYEISQIGDKVSFVFMPHKLHFFDSTTEKTI